MNEKISVIVPVYNAEKTLDRCIAALMNQTYRNIEIILINDGSKDDSLSVCKKYAAKDQRIMVIDKPNGGVSSARNSGLGVATGEFIMFCDSDDWAEPDWCEELISHYEENCLVMCGCYVEGEQKFVPHEIHSVNGCTRYKSKEFFELKLSSFNAPWNKIYSTPVLWENHLHFNEALTNGEDYLFNLQYLTCISGDILYLDKCVFHYEWPREGSLSKLVPDGYLEQCCLLSNRVLELIKELGLDSENGYRQLMTDFYNEFQKITISVLKNDNLSVKEKLGKLKVIMSTAEYQRCAAKAYISTNPIYSYLCQQKNGVGLWLWHQIQK